MPPNKEKASIVTGQLIIRETNSMIPGATVKGRTPGGRRLVMIMGVIALPKGVDLKGEHVYVVVSDELQMAMDPTGPLLLMVLNNDNQGKPIPEDYQGLRADQLLCDISWQV